MTTEMTDLGCFLKGCTTNDVEAEHAPLSLYTLSTPFVLLFFHGSKMQKADNQPQERTIKKFVHIYDRCQMTNFSIMCLVGIQNTQSDAVERQGVLY